MALPALMAILVTVNAERNARGVAPLVEDACLSAVAAARAQDMVNRDYFSHITPDGRTPWDAMQSQGCSMRHFAGENIAEADDVSDALTLLWNSAEHRANTLDAHYRKIGVGIATRPDGTEVVVEDFSG